MLFDVSWQATQSTICGQSQIRKAGAVRDVGVARRAVEIELLLHREMRNVSELDVDIFARYRSLSDHAALFGEAGILNFLRSVAAHAALCVECGSELRFHAGLGVASGALCVPREFREHALLIELMAERAIGTEAGGQILAALSGPRDWRARSGTGSRVFRGSAGRLRHRTCFGRLKCGTRSTRAPEPWRNCCQSRRSGRPCTGRARDAAIPPSHPSPRCGTTSIPSFRIAPGVSRGRMVRPLVRRAARAEALFLFDFRGRFSAASGLAGGCDWPSQRT